MNPVHCECGALIVEDVGGGKVTPLGGVPIQFRRDTDYVVCTNCHRVYRAKTLQEGGTLAESLVRAEEADDAIAKLEELVENED
jgi:hypothetical protein